VNVCLVTALSNQIIAGKKPSEYLNELKNSHIESTLKTHLLKGETYKSLMTDDFQEFLSNRVSENGQIPKKGKM